ncbi:MAG: Uma2 family endonuclease [Cyanobacteria bacterium P01_D01_bin.14]
MIAVPHYITAREYLAIEQQSPCRHEYRRGLVYAMAGRTDRHDRIAFNFLRLIDDHLGDNSGCRFYSGNVKVGYQDELYYYPDAFVTCDSRDRDSRYIKRYPKLIVEVLSSSTQEFDRGEKFEDYKQIEALEEYVLVTQDQQHVERRRRTATGDWETQFSGSDQTIKLESIGLEFAIAALYRGLDG